MVIPPEQTSPHYRALDDKPERTHFADEKPSGKKKKRGRPSLPRPPPSPHLSCVELAARWHMSRGQLSRVWRLIGLRPIQIGRQKLIFSIDDIQDAEERMRFPVERIEATAEAGK